MNWGKEDYLSAALLIGGLVAGFTLMLRMTSTTRSRIVYGLILLAIFAAIWIELAVGIFD